MAGAVWVTEEERNRTSGSWGDVVRGKEWGRTRKDGGPQWGLGNIARVRHMVGG